MGRYIDADAMLEYLELAYDNHSDMDTLYNTGVLAAINYIKHKADTIDIIRCKECRHWSYGKDFCTLHDMGMMAEDFCSYGEVRDE